MAGLKRKTPGGSATDKVSKAGKPESNANVNVPKEKKEKKETKPKKEETKPKKEETKPKKESQSTKSASSTTTKKADAKVNNDGDAAAKKASTTLTKKVASGSPYQLNNEQVTRASTALLKHIKSDTERKPEKDSGPAGETKKKNLLAAEDGDADSEEDDTVIDSDSPLWLILTTKKHVVDKNRLKPSKIAVPHSLYDSPNLRICLITADPQRAVKDAIESPLFPKQLTSRITKVIGYSKLKAKYHTYESRRQLHAEHDIFLADERIVMRLIDSLGKIFYKSSKRPIPINIAEVQKVNGKRVAKEDRKRPPTDEKYAAVAGPLIVAKAIEKALESVPVQLAPSTTTSVKVGKVAFNAQQITDNVKVVVEELTKRFVSNGWRNVKAIHLKGQQTMALPIWLASELWVDEEDVVDDEEKESEEKPAKKRIR